MADSSTNYVAMDGEGEAFPKKMARYVGAVVGVFLIIAVLIQGLEDYYMLKYGCSGDVKTHFPLETLLIEEKPSFLGGLFAIYPSDEQNRITGSPVGYIERVEGPFHNNYALVDATGSGQTIATAQTVFFALSRQLIVKGCNGVDEFLLNEGVLNHILNLFRKLFKSFTQSEFKLYRTSPHYEEIATSEKNGFAVTALTITGEELAIKSVLIDRHFHGHLDEWWVNETRTSKADLPSYMGPLLTSQMAFALSGRKPSEDQHTPRGGSPQAFLALGDASAAALPAAAAALGGSATAAAPFPPQPREEAPAGGGGGGGDFSPAAPAVELMEGRGDAAERAPGQPPEPPAAQTTLGEEAQAGVAVEEQPGPRS